MIENLFVVKVLLRRGVWRRIQLVSKHTLHDLHKAILEAYDFSDDHLYAFFMNGQPWRGEAYWSPNNDEGPYADKIKLGNLNLEIKQKFLYLYDFGDEWTFSIQVEKILETDVPVLKPIIFETRGEAPEQY
ncbi:MAG: plasmid pRiA4b family protein [Firmicutes bacterium]|nr:plasmid pRiA4b family protein [Bacillota bacterium]